MSTWKGIVARSFRPQEFKAYIGTLTFTDWRPQFVVLHNTSEPRLSQWHSTPGERRMANLEDYYKNQMKWSAGPHLFVADDFIWVFTPLTTSGVHSPSWNAISWGVEMVGEYEEEPFGPAVRENTVDALAILHAWRGLDPATLRFHKEDPKTTHKECPGHNVDKADIIARVVARMSGPADGEHLPDRLASGNNGSQPVAAPTSAPTTVSGTPVAAATGLPALPGAVVAAAATTPGGGVALEVSVPAATGTTATAAAPAAPAVGASTAGLLRSPLLATDPVLQRVAAGDLVLAPVTPLTRQDGVGALQDALNRLAAASGNEALAVDLAGGASRGFYGDKTMAAVRAFQETRHIGLDGKTGPQTLRKLDEALLTLEAGDGGAPPAFPDADGGPVADTRTPEAPPTGPIEKEIVRDDSVTIFKLKDRPGFFFQGRLRVDADGAPRCYHPEPDDHLGLDDLGNATPNSKKFIQGQNGVGPAEGFYVSQTSLQAGPDDHCDSFVDADSIPYVVFYSTRKFPDLKLGDMGMVISLVTGKRTHVIIADGNNETKGEASMQTARNLKLDPSPKNGGDDYYNYLYLLFPETKFEPVNPAPHWPDDKIKAVAEAAFAAWGGMATLRQCFPQIPAGAV